MIRKAERRSGHRPRHRCNREEGRLHGRQRLSCNLGIGTPRFPRHAIGIRIRQGFARGFAYAPRTVPACGKTDQDRQRYGNGHRCRQAAQGH